MNHTERTEVAGPVLSVRGLRKHFKVSRARGGGMVHAVDGVDLTINSGEIVGLVGESGSGKSTLARCIVRLLEPTGGQVLLRGADITHLSQRRLRPVRRDVHMVFQDPYSSLDPRQTVRAIIAEPLRMHGLARGRELDKRVAGMLERVGLSEDMRDRLPNELSGGQRQRVGLARSLVLEPGLLIADEPVSALDVSVQASVLGLILDLQEDMGFACLFIAHDLGAVEAVCNRVAIMYLGRIVEQGGYEEIFRKPKHPYTQSLLSAAPVPDPAIQRSRRRVVLVGDIPSPIHPPSGCRFHTRCPVAALPLCGAQDPDLRDVTGAGHLAACHLITADGTPPDVTGELGTSPEGLALDPKP
jgi:oligopeptide transport system ATP-binding protein